jgi:sugar O-acyltransferase (sialic acid O-acetyltransferase NeuD family)
MRPAEPGRDASADVGWSGRDYVLVGAGGHAKVLAEILEKAGARLSAYVDVRESTWLDARRYADDGSFSDLSHAVVVGMAGIRAAQLRRRLAIADGWIGRGFELPPVVHPAAWVSRSAVLGPGVQILAGAIVQPGARLGRGAIVNSASVVEHDAVVGPGCHLAPGSVVLADSKVGACAMIGANAVVLRGTEVPDDSLVRSLELYRAASGGARHDARDDTQD